MWDADQYERFRGERSRPFFDLLTRIPDRSYRTLIDLGCGTGDLTAALADHWPEARVTGVDLSAEMLAPAKARAVEGQLEFVQADIASWRPPAPVELAVSNAAFQWVKDQPALLKHVVSTLAPKGVLAVQIPDNFGSPSHTLLDEVEEGGPWREKLRTRHRHDGVLPLSGYVELLWGVGMDVDAWEMTYHHVLAGADAVLEWMKGTALRPILAALEDPERRDFLGAYGAKLRTAYPPSAQGTLFPFRRIFFVARKP
ncbi:MAG: methyltransferase domain-containing protein [Planctomycetes bacterium]|nr:methyltransferase domain-containing protein [Planctomycetota bacterium]